MAIISLLSILINIIQFQFLNNKFEIISILKITNKIILIMSSEEEEECIVQCLKCKKEICEKPWITVKMDNQWYHGCSYLCANNFRELIGVGYWNHVVNKEDFNEPRPIYGYTNRILKKDITTGFGMDEIREEVKRENERIEMIELDFEDDYDSNDSFDEDNYY